MSSLKVTMGYIFQYSPTFIVIIVALQGKKAIAIAASQHGVGTHHYIAQPMLMLAFCREE